MTKRKLEFDNLKGILIYFVVLGHLLLSFNHANTLLSQKITAFIYCFHMPIFFIVSGYFSQKKIDKITIIKLLFIFITMNLSFTIYDYLVQGTYKLLVFKYSSWYILLLLIFRLFIKTNIFKKIIEHKQTLLLVSLELAVLIGFINTDLFILRIFENWIYFLVGYLLFNHKKYIEIKNNNLLLSIGLLFLISIFYIITFEYSYNIYFYLGEGYNQFNDCIIRFIITISNILAFIISSNLISNKEIPFLTRFGQNSLYIYILHRIPTLILGEIFIVDRKLIIILDIIIAFVLCIILSSKIIVRITNAVIDFFTAKYYQKNILLIICTFILFIYLIIFGLSVKGKIDFNTKQSNKDTVTIGFVGDLILLEDQVKLSKNLVNYDFDYMFKHTNKYFKDTDYVIGVFEGPSDDSQQYSVGNYNDGKELKINHPSKFINSIKKSGIDLVTTSNNHVYDRGYSGALATMNNLSNRGLKYVGASLDENPQSKIVNIEGLKVGFLAYTFYSNYPNDTTNPEVIRYLANPEQENFEEVKNEVIKDFDNLKKQDVDLIIVLPHYGTEFNFDFTSYQEVWNEVFVSNGADIIFGDHSHVIGPIKYYGETVAVSSPGNYVNSYNGQDSDISNYIKVEVDKKSKKVTNTKVIPMLAQKEDKGFYPIPLYDLSKQDKDNNRLQESLAIFGKVLFNDENIKLQKEYTVSKENKEELNLEITDIDKESTAYKLIESSNKICFIGDSITEGTMNDFHPWYEPLMSNFDKEVVNISKGSYMSANILEVFSDDIKKSNCDLSIINIGTNDIRYSMIPKEEYKKNIEKIISLTKPQSNIILLSPWETYSNDKVIGNNILRKKDLYGYYNSSLISISREKENVIYINPIRYIKSKINKYKETTYLLDGVHPNSDEGIKLYSIAVLRGEHY